MLFIGAAWLSSASTSGRHYVLLTGIEEDKILVFDPYYEEELTEDCPGVELDNTHLHL